VLRFLAARGHLVHLSFFKIIKLYQEDVIAELVQFLLVPVKSQVRELDAKLLQARIVAMICCALKFSRITKKKVEIVRRITPWV
jgi:hypothetical protein